MQSHLMYAHFLNHKNSEVNFSSFIFPGGKFDESGKNMKILKCLNQVVLLHFASNKILM